MFKKVVIVGVAILALLLGAMFILPSLVPSDVYKTRLETELSNALARDVTLEGEVNIRTFPFVSVTTGRVEIANPEGFSADNLLTMGGLEGRVKLWPLLSKRVEISKFILEKPEITLIRTADGAVNWTVGSQDTVKEETGPFKRDGRFTEFDPSLDAVSIRDGRLTYSDEQTGETFQFTELSMAMSLPGLARPLSVNGEVTYDGIRLEIDGRLDSPEAFLKGEAAAFDIKAVSDLFDLKSAGNFRAGQDIALDGTLDMATRDAKSVLERLPLPGDLTLPPLQTVKLTSQVSYDAAGPQFTDMVVELAGQGFKLDYTGRAGFLENLTADGRFDVSLTESAILKPYLPNELKGVESLQRLVASGQVKVDGTTYSANGLNADVTGDGYAAKFNGNASFKDDVLGMDGPFEASATDIYATLAKFGQDIPEAKAVRSGSAKGRFSTDGAVLKVADLDVVTTGGVATGDFKGQGEFDEALTLSGNFNANISSFSELDALLPQTLPYASALGRGEVSGALDFSKSGTKVTALTATLSEGDINGRYDGEFTLADQTSLDGTLSVQAANIRALAASNGTILPANPDTGAIFTAGSLTGRVSGTPERLAFKSGELNFDNITGTGDFAVVMTGEKPMITGGITLSELDLRPYMDAWSAQRPQGEILPWSEETIDLSGLKAVDANIDVKASSVKMARLTLGETTLATTLKNGVLESNMSSVRLYDGAATGTFALDASKSVPSISLNTDLLKLNGGTFLSSLAGFDRLTGLSDMTIRLSGQGQSQAAIMRSLTGAGDFSVFEGRLKGIDASAFLTGLDQALTSRQLPDGLGVNQVTAFQDLIGKFTMVDGVAQLDNFDLSAGNLAVTGDGQIDIGRQTIDFSFRPKLNTGSDLASFGIPLQFSGGFGQAKAGLDTDYLSQIVQARAKAAAEKKVRGEVNRVLGGLLGGTSEPSNETGTPPTAQEEPKAEQPKTEEENPAKTVLDLFGRLKKETTQD